LCFWQESTGFVKRQIPIDFFRAYLNKFLNQNTNFKYSSENKGGRTMKKILIVALLILFITITASSIGAVEFGANSANMNQIYLPTKNFQLHLLLVMVKSRCNMNIRT